ncbi:MAG: hypothetical protein GY841_05335, partial [FCB group bacterium]|nr:hypothetical protein [FCB group bacterium]
DTTTPVVNLESPSNETWSTTTGNVTFTCNATNMNLTNISLYHNIEGTWELNQTALITGVANESSFNVSGIGENNTGYLWNCEAYDSAGNSNFSGVNWTFYVDTVNPEINVSVNDTTVEWSDDHVLIDWNFTDLNSSFAIINVTYPNGTLLTTSTNQSANVTLLTANLSTSGVYTISILVNDTAGNENLTTTTFTVVDTTTPVVTLESPSNETWSTTTGNVTFTCNATNMNLTNISLYHNIDGTWKINQTSLISGTANESSFNVSGIADNNTGYLWNCEAYDSAGNSNFSGVNWTFYVDTVNPEVNLSVNDTAIEWSDDHVLIDWNFTDLNFSFAIINVTYPNGTLLTTSTNQSANITLLTVNFTVTGVYSVTVFVNDTAGNENLTVVNITVGDQTNPVVTLESPSNETWSTTTGNVTFTCNATDMNLTNITLYHNIEGTWELNQTALITGVANESSFNVSGIGENNTGYLWNCEAYDSAGNSNFSGVNWTFFVDTINPEVNVSVNDSNLEWGVASLLIDWNFTD